MRQSVLIITLLNIALVALLISFQNCAKGFKPQSSSDSHVLGDGSCDRSSSTTCDPNPPPAGNPPSACAAPSLGPGPGSGSANAVVAGAVSVPFPTLQNVSIEWAISGDQNNNSEVLVRYRKRGEPSWLCGMPLRLIPGASLEGFSWTTRHSGSLFDLDPGVTYELELTLNDPDGGSVVKTTAVTTRTVPLPMTGAPVKSVSPSTLNSTLSTAQPGDIISLSAGTYSGFQVNVSGQPNKPIVIRGAANAVINGEVGAFSRSHLIFESLSVNGRIRLNGSDDVAVVRSHVTASTASGGDGIVAYTRAENLYIADNIVEGTTTWAESSLGVDGNNLGEGILVTGPGHVIAHNKVSGFRDGISFLEDDEAVDQLSIDVLNNEISSNADDGVEADFCKHNCRIMRNRLTNNFIALSSQPSLGGPTYFVRNSVYNVVHVAFKLYRGSIGDVLLHNTVVKNGDGFGIYAGRSVSRSLILNNIFIGGPGGDFGGYSSGTGKVVALADLTTNNSIINYQAYGTSNGNFSGTIGSTSFTSLAGLRANTQEKNAIQIDLSAFAAAVAYPSSPMSSFAPADLRLKPTSAPVDAALPISNINDRHFGLAPDTGAFEVGAAFPVFGPRP